MRNFLSLALLTVSLQVSGQTFEVGFSKIDITPYEFEVQKNPGFYYLGHPYWDTGVDRRFDFEEPRAFGLDGQPGVAGIDDDGNGVTDDCSRERCAEYKATFSDDIADPARDNYNSLTNPQGTENDGVFNYVTLGGFGPYYPLPFLENRMAQGVHDPIWARAIAITGQNGETSILISTDLPGLVWKHINPVRRQIERVYGVPAKNIIITSTHNHAAPDASGYWSTLLPGRNKTYTDQLRIWLFNAAAEAIRNREPATMKVVMGDPISCYQPATGEWKRGRDCNMPANSTDYKIPGHTYDYEAVQVDKRDPKVRNNEYTAAQFVSTRTGKTLGTFLNWHNHPDSLSSDNLMLTSEFIGYLRDYVESKIGGIAVYFSGTVGCQIGQAHYIPKWDESMNPVFDESGRAVPAENDRWVKIRSAGFEVASSMVQDLAVRGSINSSSDVVVHTRALDIAPVNLLHIITTRSVWFTDVAWQDRMRFYGPRCLSLRGCVRSDVSKLELGELTIMTAPGEIDPVYWLGREESTADYGGKTGKVTFRALRGVKENLRSRFTAVLGQANNYLSYLLPKADNVGPLNFKHPNHYEEFVTVNKHFGDDLGNLWMEMTGDSYRYNRRKIFPRQ